MRILDQRNVLYVRTLSPKTIVLSPVIHVLDGVILSAEK